MQLRWWFGFLFGVLVDFCKNDGWVSWVVLFGVLFSVLVRAHVCSIDGRALLGAFFWGGAFGGAGGQALLSGIYAGVIYAFGGSTGISPNMFPEGKTLSEGLQGDALKPQTWDRLDTPTRLLKYSENALRL